MDINAPVFPESIADGEVASWHVAVGQWVARDQILVDIETDKVVLGSGGAIRWPADQNPKSGWRCGGFRGMLSQI